MSLHIIDAEDNRPWHPASGNWPLLIHGRPKSGASLFTVVLTAELIRRGARLVFLCAKGEAVRALQSELGLKKSAMAYQQVSEAAVEALESMQLVTFFRRPGFDLLQSLRSLTDWGRRIVVVKNAEELLNPPLWAVLQPHRRLIVSGDFNLVSDTAIHEVLSTKILFSASPPGWSDQRSNQPDYVGECIRHNNTQLLMVA